MQRITVMGLLLVGHSLAAQDVTLSGVLPAAAGKNLELTNLDEQKWTIQTDASGKFKQSFSDIPAGYYTLTEIGNLYLKPGYSLEIAGNKDQVSMKGKGSAENNALQEIRIKSNKMREDVNEGKYNLTEIPDFLKILQDFRNSEIRKMEKRKLDPSFIALRKADLDFISRNLLREYQFSYGVDVKKREAFYALLDKIMGQPDFAEKYDSAQKAMELRKMTPEDKKKLDSLVTVGADFNNEEYYRGSAAYRRWIDQSMQTLFYTKYRDDFMKGVSMQKANGKMIEQEFSNPFIRDHMRYQNTSVQLKMSGSVEAADSIYQAYSQLNKNKTYGTIVDGIYKKIKQFSVGSAAPEFDYYTASGEKVSLSSLAGNVVYIDVWATWCGPCKAEIPHLKKIEEAYRGKKIKFVSISVDEPKDKEKWRSFVSEKELEGIQLIADDAFRSEFIKDFNIVAIPRFILIDGNGKIVSANALRPSNKLLTAELDKLL